jgi:ketosteroid isomerase-like protein
MGSADEAVVLAFNAAINRSDLQGLGQLMADDHRFIDTAGNTSGGRGRFGGRVAGLRRMNPHRAPRKTSTC